MTEQIYPQRVERNGFVATLDPDTMAWGQGAITPRPEFASLEQQTELLRAVLDNIKPVAPQELAYSSCTDGRRPRLLESGESVPVREQLVGADALTFFSMHEALARYLYGNSNSRPRLMESFSLSMQRLQKQGIYGSSHINCGAGAGFAVINQKLVHDFSANEDFRSRTKRLAPAGVYSKARFDELTQNTSGRLVKYKADWQPDEMLNIVRSMSGKRAVARLQAGENGHSGHVEEMIIRQRVAGHAIDEAGVFDQTGGREVFGVNDNRIKMLAGLAVKQLPSTGDRAELLALAQLSGEIWTNSGHGTLAKDLPTYYVTAA